MRIKLHKRIFLNFVLGIALFCILGCIIGAWLMNRNILNEAQRRVSLDLGSAWSVIQGDLDKLHLFINVLGTGKRVEAACAFPDSSAYRADLEAARRQFGFDFLSLTDNKGKVIVRTLEPYNTGDYLCSDPFVSSALKGKTVSGFSILNSKRLLTEGGNLEERSFMVFEPTPKAKLRAKKSESSGMALVAACPIEDETGNIIGSIYAGVLLNRNHSLVDKIRSIVFENKMYKGHHLGTVTIFQWDTRIATNVALANGNKAIGTRVSADVYDKVLENNQNWYDRAFVVNDWYLSAYDPIHDIEGKVIGILYVGVLAKKYDDQKQELWRIYGALSIAVAIFVLAVGLIFSRRLTGSLSRLADAAGKIATGNLDLNVEMPSTDDEVRDLTFAFNAMAGSLRDRDEKLRAANQELEEINASLQKLNENYLDMLGFVSHELKNTLGVIYTSARALDMGIGGDLNETQGKLVRNISRSIDTAVKMTRNYLDLARIEKGEVRVNKKPLDIRMDVVDPVLDELLQVIKERNFKLENRLPERIPYDGDSDLLMIVFKNFLDNALKYGREGGRIRLDFSSEDNQYRFEVWNEGKGLSQDQLGRLFGKFVRFQPGTGSSRSTGLGLFITKDIIRKHGGDIWAESEEGKWINFIFTLPI